MSKFTKEISRLNQRVKSCYTDLDDIILELNRFEKIYDMPSDQFFKKFKLGDLEHRTDFFEWYAYLDMCQKLIKKIRSIETKIGDELEQKLLEFA